MAIEGYSAERVKHLGLRSIREELGKRLFLFHSRNGHMVGSLG